jgi:hypothetical protein
MDVILALIVFFWPVIFAGTAIAIGEAIERRGRFSVRALLIATTMIAVALGFVTTLIRSLAEQ